MLLLQLAQHTTLLAQSAQHAHAALSTLTSASQSAALAGTPPTGTTATGNALTDIYNFVSNMQTIITIIGASIFGIGVAIAGIMRMVSMGNERRVAMSNMALTAAVIGLVIMLLANGIFAFINTAFVKPPAQ